MSSFGKMKISAILPSFFDELSKIASAELYRTKLAAISIAKAKEMATEHHATRDWDSFEKNLNNQKFRQAIILHPESDDKLKRYTKALGDFKKAKVLGVVPSRTSNKLHKIKKLPSGRLGCSCRDWQYSHSHKTSDCDHIQEFKGGLDL